MSKVYKDQKRTVRALCPLCFMQPVESGQDYFCTTECAWCNGSVSAFKNVYSCAIAKDTPLMWVEKGAN